MKNKKLRKSAKSHKAKIIADIRKAVKEMKMIKAGKLKARDAEELFNEL